MLAAAIGKTDILCAKIVIVAIKGANAHTFPFDTNVINGAGVVVITSLKIVGVQAAAVSIADVIGAGVSIVAIDGLARHADSFTAVVAVCASVGVVAGD